MNLAIIGCGNIGLRHFQSILNIKGNHELFLIDNSFSSQNIFKKYYEDNSNPNLKVFFLNNITEVNSKLEIIIVSTSSFPRRNIIEQIYKRQKPRHIILEKFLFTKAIDYTFCENLFKSNNTQVWVNQWMSNEFKEIKKYFTNNSKLDLTVSGNNWGMCCNSVHYIDLFHYLINREDIQLKSSNLEDKIYKSKRDGYYELFGSYKLISKNNHSLLLDCKKTKDEVNVNKEVYINISNSEYSIEAELDSKFLDCKIKNFKDNVLFKKKISLTFQSERTGKIIESLINTNSCNLVKYKISSEHHLLILDMFKEKFILNNYDINEGIPIS